jgi:hypothetical protein
MLEGCALRTDGHPRARWSEPRAYSKTLREVRGLGVCSALIEVLRVRRQVTEAAAAGAGYGDRFMVDLTLLLNHEYLGRGLGSVCLSPSSWPGPYQIRQGLAR